VTRPSIAAACALSRPTVFAAIERLERLALVTEVGQVSGKPGRAAALYECSASAGALAAIDIGGSNLRVAVTDVRARILAERREATAPGGGPGVVAQATRLVKSAIRSADTDAGTLVTVAVSVPGVVGHDGGTVYYATNIDQLEPFDFRGALSATLSAPVELENNVNLAAIGEQWRGVARDLSTFVVVAVGAGIRRRNRARRHAPAGFARCSRGGRLPAAVRRFSAGPHHEARSGGRPHPAGGGEGLCRLA
jgi:glucokinase